MLYIDTHEHIKSRADFFTALAKAINATNDLLKIAPVDISLTSILRQLEMIRLWTENGREPTKEERRRYPFAIAAAIWAYRQGPR
jgi:hypothetical protein